MHKKIKCPKCDNEDLSFVSGTKKGLNVFLLLIVAVLGVAVIITLFVSGYIWGAVIAIIIFSIILSILKVIQAKRKEEVHTKAICRDCGHKWFID